MTNFERIKNMTEEEMAEFFGDFFNCDECPMKRDVCCGYPDIDCKENAFVWLKRQCSNEIFGGGENA